MAPLFVWCSCGCVHRSQESSICVHSERAKSQTKKVVRVT
ncbi:hypothetical protein MTR67_008356 [Solanum verrucosum]|uniref:Uncharacterized protein n=1 Tax=Solanum verrucosum TaxID=315347 RepID=A0AAF0Q1H1_SOLVR|nr:hypothetical protein MTR67_008356 [Solanum verrucosum]